MTITTLLIPKNALGRFCGKPLPAINIRRAIRIVTD